MICKLCGLSDDQVGNFSAIQVPTLHGTFALPIHRECWTYACIAMRDKGLMPSDLDFWAGLLKQRAARAAASTEAE